MLPPLITTWLERCLAKGAAALKVGPVAVEALTAEVIQCPVCEDSPGGSFGLVAAALPDLINHLSTAHGSGPHPQLSGSVFDLFGVPGKRRRVVYVSSLFRPRQGADCRRGAGAGRLADRT